MSTEDKCQVFIKLKLKQEEELEELKGFTEGDLVVFNKPTDEEITDAIDNR